MRRTSAYVLSVLTVCLFVLSLSGCFSSRETLCSTYSYDPSSIDDIVLSYGNDNVNVYASSDDTITIKEYMSQDDPSYHATDTLDGNTLSITMGQRPSSDPYFSSYVDIYVPISYHGSLSVTTTSGLVTINSSYQLSDMSVATEGGSITLKSIACPDVTLTSDSGTISSSSSTGKLTCSTQTSPITANSISGYGSFTSDSGKITAQFKYVSGDIDVSDRAGKIALTLPSDTQMDFQATTTSGYIQTNFPTDVITQKADTELDANTASSGIVHTVTVSSVSGAINASLS